MSCRELTIDDEDLVCDIKTSLKLGEEPFFLVSPRDNGEVRIFTVPGEFDVPIEKVPSVLPRELTGICIFHGKGSNWTGISIGGQSRWNNWG